MYLPLLALVACGTSEGAYDADPGGPSSGAVYVKFGPLTGALDLVTDADVLLRGEGRDFYSGRTLRAGDDVSGDGVGDVIVAAPYASAGASYSGVVYVVHGPPGDMDLADADGRFVGESSSGYAGTTLGRGDADGDGLGDVLAGAWDSTGGAYAGAAYVVFGPAARSASFSESDLIVRGNSAGQDAGTGLAAGSVQGQPALLVGAPGDTTGGSAAGAAYLFVAPTTGTWSVGDADEAWFGDRVGMGLGEGTALADIDGDGSAEAVLGAPKDDTGAVSAGAIWVIGLW